MPLPNFNIILNRRLRKCAINIINSSRRIINYYYTKIITIVRTGKAENGGKSRGFTGVGTARKTDDRILTTRTGGPRGLGLNEVHCAGLSKLLRTSLIILSCSSLYSIQVDVSLPFNSTHLFE